MHRMFLEIYMARGELCLPKNNILETPNAIRPESIQISFAYISVGEQTEKIKKWYHDRIDLFFGKHTTMHKTQDLAESRASDVRSPKSRSEFEWTERGSS